MQSSDPKGGLGQGGPGDQAGPSADPRDTGRAGSQQGRPQAQPEHAGHEAPARRSGPAMPGPPSPARGETATERGEAPGAAASGVRPAPPSRGGG